MGSGTLGYDLVQPRLTGKPNEIKDENNRADEKKSAAPPSGGFGLGGMSGAFQWSWKREGLGLTSRPSIPLCPAFPFLFGTLQQPATSQPRASPPSYPSSAPPHHDHLTALIRQTLISTSHRAGSLGLGLKYLLGEVLDVDHCQPPTRT